MAIFFLLKLICKNAVSLSRNETLNSLLVYGLPTIILLGSIIWLGKKNIIDLVSIENKKVKIKDVLISICITLLIFLNPFLSQFSIMSEEARNSFIGTLVPGDFYVFLTMVIVAPVFEELLFRGVIFRGLKENYPSFWAFTISALFFGLLHTNIITSIILALFWSWLYYNTKNISVCIISHATCNLIGFVLRVYIQKGNDINIFYPIEEHLYLISIGLTFMAGLLFFIMFKRLKYHQMEEKIIDAI